MSSQDKREFSRCTKIVFVDMFVAVDGVAAALIRSGWVRRRRRRRRAERYKALVLDILYAVG
jgi:hypothetical protein